MFLLLKEFAQLKGWEIDQKSVTGEEQGYLITIVEGQGYKLFITSLIGINESQKTKVITYLNDQKFDFMFSEVSFEDSVLYFKIKEHLKQLNIDDIRKVLTLLTDYLKGQAIGITKQCIYCKDRNTDTKTYINGIGYYAHEKCLKQDLGDRKKVVVEYNFLKKNYVQGAIGAILGALPGALLWIVVSHFGWYVSFIGYLIGKGAIMGYDKFGGRFGRFTRWIMLVIVFVMVALAEFATYPLFLYMENYEVSLENIKLLFEEPENMTSYLVSLGIGLLFAYLGIYSLFRDLRDIDDSVIRNK